MMNIYPMYFNSRLLACDKFTKDYNVIYTINNVAFDTFLII